MNCGNCGKGNEYGAKVCVHCGSTLALTEYFRPTGFVEKKNTPKKPEKEPWDQEILTAGYQKKKKAIPSETKPKETEKPKTSQGKRSTPRPETPSSGKKPPATTERKPRNGAQEPKTGGKGEKKSVTGRGQGKEEQKPRPASSKPTPKKTKEPKKEISNSKVYNHTTKKLSIAEKMVKKKTERGGRKWVLPVILVAAILIGAAVIFMVTINSGTRQDRFVRVAEDFVRAVVMNDENGAAECIHPKMYGTVRAMDYKNVTRCEAKAISVEKLEKDALGSELEESYGITDPLGELYRVEIGYTVYGEQTYGATQTMNVLVAEIDGKVYAVKTDNLSVSPEASEKNE